MTYFYSSALVKRYLKEDGSDAVRSIIAGARVIATSKLAYPEIRVDERIMWGQPLT